MNSYKDLFISYGRRESLGFVARLHQQLKLAGFDGWFDKVNIPDGEDYAARINHGIESAHNFVYVMAPRALCSPYCLIELEYARVLGKRVIPINQMVIFQADDGELSEGDKQVLHGFYAFHGLEDPNINTAQQVLERSLKVVGRTDWLDGKENLSNEDCKQLAAWAQAYENHWHKHEELAYLQTLELPVFGDNIDTLDSVIERINIVLERHTHYVEQHTEVLAQALLWQANQRATRYLPVGEERHAAQNWLLTAFQDGEQAPCEPSHVVCEFICEARKNGENLLTEAFICYDVDDKPMRDVVVRTLSRHAITTWQHDRDIQTGSRSESAILEGIAGATNVLYFISPRSVQSEYCQKELDYALSLNKRIIPILLEATPDVPAVLDTLQYINFCAEDGTEHLLHALNHERSYYEHHKMLLTRALKWQANAQGSAFLLRGHHLENAKIWLRLNENRSQQAPTALHQDLIQHSEALKGQLGTDVFISYSRKDGDFARQMNIQLQEAGKTTWFDQESIASGVDFETELYKGIDSADNFVFILSPDSVESQYCKHEVDYAHEQGKRILTVLARDTDPQTLPENLKAINWIDFIAHPFADAFADLIQELDLDREHVQQHTQWQQRAMEWQRQTQSTDFLLNQTACEKAETWLEHAQATQKNPPPTAFQQQHIHSSRAAIEAAQRKEKRRQRFMLVGLVLALVLAGFAWMQMKEAQVQKQTAQQQTQRALHNQSRFLSEQARQLSEQNKPMTAMRVALEALPNTSETYPQRAWLLEAQQQLYHAIQKNWQGVLEHDDSVDGAEFSPDGTQLLTWAGRQAYLWDRQQSRLLRVFSGHIDRVTHASFAPDGKRLVTVSNDKTAHLWDADSGALLQRIGEVNHASFSPNGKALVTVSNDKTARLWDTNSGALLYRLEGHEGSVTHASFAPDGKRLVTASEDNTAHLWDADSGALLHHLEGHEGGVLYASFAPDGKRLVTASWDKTARLWDVDSGALLQRLEGHEGSVTHASFAPDSKTLVTTSRDKTARLWDVDSGVLLHRLEGHEHLITHASFAPDGKRLVTASKDNTARLWDADSGALLQRIEGHEGEVNHASFAPDSKTLVTTSRDKTARLWNADSGALLHHLEGHEGAVFHVSFAPDGKRLVTASNDKTARLWDADSGALLHRLEGHTGSVTHASFAPDGKRLVTASYDKTARLWDTDSGALLHRLEGHTRGVTHASFAPDGKRLVTTSGDKTARLWDVDSGALLHRLKGHRHFLMHASFAPDGKRLVTTSSDKTPRLWDADSGVLLHRLEGHNMGVFHASFAPDGKTLVTASIDNTARLWDADSGAVLHRLEGHTGSVTHASFAPDGKRLVTTSSDNTARLWDADSGVLLRRLEGHADVVLHANFAPDGKRLVTTSKDKTTRLWDVGSGALLYRLKGHKSAVNHASFAPDGKRLVTASNDNTARLWLVFTDLSSLVSEAQTRLPQRLSKIAKHHLSCTERQSYFMDYLPRCASVLDPHIAGYYQGEIKNQQAHGQGHSQGRNHYQGGFKQGMKHGHGVYTWAEGGRYEGEFANDEAVGLEHFDATNPYAWYEAARYEEDTAKVQSLLQTQLKITPQHALSFVRWGELLVKQDKEHTAIEKFQQALVFDPNLGFDPEQKVKQLRIAVLIDRIYDLAGKGKIDQALSQLQQAQVLDANVKIEVSIWNELCRYGALHQQADKVLNACEQAVTQSNGDVDMRDSRGIARALTGDIAGALDDFRFYVAENLDEAEEAEVLKRVGWIDCLERGENPFTEAVLESLR